ncbi:MAG TPA: ABC transporter permease subunit, partial [Thermoanaerobaculia bacterium]
MPQSALLRTAPVPPPAPLPGPWTTPPRALGTIFRHELRRTAASGRFLTAASLLVAVMAFAAVGGGARYHNSRLAQQAIARDYDAQLSGATVDQVAAIRHPAMKAPWRLSWVADGGQSTTPDLCEQALSALVAPRIGRSTQGNPRLSPASPLDWMFVLRVLLPLLAFLLGFDGVCGERRAGSLKLLLSYPVPRSRVLAGKILALWTCLAAPLLAGAALSLGLAWTVGGVPFVPTDLGRALLVLLLGLWAALFFVLAALLVSTLSSDSSISLSVLTWLWVTGLIVAPAVSGLLAHRLRPLPSNQEIQRQFAAIDRQVSREYADREGHWRPTKWAAADGYAWEKVSAAAEDLRDARREAIRRGGLLRKIEQARMAELLGAFSPISLTNLLGEQLAGTGRERDESFLRQAWRFRDLLGERVRALDGADPASPHVLFFPGYLSQRQLPAAYP